MTAPMAPRVRAHTPYPMLIAGMASPAEQTTKLLLAGFVDIVQAISGDGLYAEVTASKPNYEVGSTGGMLSFAAPAQALNFGAQALSSGIPADTGPAAEVASVWQISGDDFGDDMVSREGGGGGGRHGCPYRPPTAEH